MPYATALVLAAVLGVGNAAEREPTSKTEGPEEAREIPPGKDSATGDEQPKAPTSTPPSDPPPDLSIDAARGPDVTLIAGQQRTVYEYRQNGKLLMIKVVPRIGKPYFLAPRDPTRGFGDLEQADTLVPRWVLIEF